MAVPGDALRSNNHKVSPERFGWEVREHPFLWEDGAAVAQVTRKVGESLAAEGVKAHVGRATAELILCWLPMWCWKGTSGNP